MGTGRHVGGIYMAKGTSQRPAWQGHHRHALCWWYPRENLVQRPNHAPYLPPLQPACRPALTVFSCALVETPAAQPPSHGGSWKSRRK